MRRLLALLPLALIFAVVGFGLFRVQPDVGLGHPAPDFTLPTLEDPDRNLSLADFRGRPVVVNFWASWCDPCRDEAPELAEVADAHADEVAFLGVSILDGREEGLAFQEEFGIPYASVRDASARVSRLYGVTGVPETVFVDAEGVLVGTYIGAFLPGQLERLVRDLLELRPGQTLDIVGRGETRPVP